MRRSQSEFAEIFCGLVPTGRGDSVHESLGSQTIDVGQENCGSQTRSGLVALAVARDVAAAAAAIAIGGARLLVGAARGRLAEAESCP